MVLNPNSAQLLLASGWIYLYAGEWALARDELERSIRLSPLDPEMPLTLTGLSAALPELGELERALELARKAVAMGYGLSTAFHKFGDVFFWRLVTAGQGLR